MSKASFIKIFVFLGAVVLLSACDKTCDASKESVCEAYVPANESCQTTYSKWFYDEGSNTCQLVTYTGCTQRGFESEAACQVCICD